MPTAPGVAHNYHLNDRLNALRAVLNVNHRLRLFKTPASGIDPSWTWTAFGESTFPGYPLNGVPLDNDFGASVQVVNGEFQISGTSHAFSFTSGSPENCYGWVITDSTPEVRFSYLFASPVWMTNGVTIYVQPIVQDWSYTVVP